MKQLTPAKAMELIASLGQLRGYPTGNIPAIKRLVDALLLKGKEPVEEAIAVAVVDSFGDADSETQCPLPNDIRTALMKHLDEYRWDPNCPKCHGDGVYPRTRVVRPGKLDQWVGGVIDCDCLGRRPAPVWEKESAALPADHVPEEYREMLEAIKRAKGVVQ